MWDDFSLAGFEDGVFSGDLWEVPDRLITFADDDPNQRTFHRMRPAVVLQGDEFGQNVSCETVLACLLSSNTSRRQTWETHVTPIEAMGLRVESLVKVQLMQPFSRGTFLARGKKIGFVSEETCLRIRKQLIVNLGLSLI